jgi:hypothetical protein
MRYEDVDSTVKDLFDATVTEYFPELINVKIKLVFDNKKRKSKGQLVLARIKKADDLLQFLTTSEVEEGYNYVLFLDKTCWNHIEDIDRIRILRHELNHVHIDFDSATNPYKTVDHDFSDFRVEVERNADDPSWSIRIAELTNAIYEQEADSDE